MCAAVEQARAFADGKDVLVAGGVSIAQQALADGLVDEVVSKVEQLVGGEFGCSASARWTCGASRPSRARQRSTCATKWCDLRPGRWEQSCSRQQSTTCCSCPSTVHEVPP